MAAGDITNNVYVKNGTAGGLSSVKFVSADVEFDTASVNVTAAQLGLKKIFGFSGGVMGGTTGKANTVSSTDAYVSGGRDELDLECIVTDETASTISALTVPMIFWGS